MPNLAKKFGPNTEAFQNTKLATSSPMPYGSDYVDERRYNISNPEYGSISGSQTVYDTYYGYNVGQLSIPSDWTYFENYFYNARGPFWRHNMCFDAVATSHPYVDPSDWANFSGGSQSSPLIRAHEGGDFNGSNFQDYHFGWQREQGYIVVASNYTTQQDSSLRTANDWALTVKLLSVPYIAPITDLNINPINPNPDILGYNFNRPYDSNTDGTFTGNSGRSWARLQTQYGFTYEPDDTPWDDKSFPTLTELLSITVTGSDYSRGYGSPDAGGVTDVRFVDFENGVPKEIHVCLGTKIKEFNLTHDSCWLDVPVFFNGYSSKQFYRPSAITESGMRLLSDVTDATFTDIRGFEWSENGYHCYVLGTENDANGDSKGVLYRCDTVDAPFSPKYSFSSLTQKEKLFVFDESPGNNQLSKLNIDREWQANIRGQTNKYYTPTVPFKCDISAGLLFERSTPFFNGQCGQKAHVLSFEAESNGLFFDGHEQHLLPTFDPSIYPGIADNRLDYITVSTQNNPQTISWRPVRHGDRENEHRRVRQCVFSTIISNPFESPKNQYYFLETATIPSNLSISNDGSTVEQYSTTHMYQKRPGSTLEVDLSEFESGPTYQKINNEEFRSFICGLWSPNGERFIWMTLIGSDVDIKVGNPFNNSSNYGTRSNIRRYKLCQVTCSTGFDLSTADWDNFESHFVDKMFHGELAPNYDSDQTDEQREISFGYSWVYEETFLNYGACTRGFRSWRQPYKLKWAAANETINNGGTLEYTRHEYGFALAVLWQGSELGNDSYFYYDYHREARRLNRANNYHHDVLTYIGLTPDTNTDGFDISGKTLNFVFDGLAPQQINLEGRLVGWQGTHFSSDDDRNPIVKKWDNATEIIKDNAVLGPENTFSQADWYNHFYINDFDYYDNGYRMLIVLTQVQPAYVRGTGSVGYMGTWSTQSKDALGREIWCVLKLAEPYTLGSYYYGAFKDFAPNVQLGNPIKFTTDTPPISNSEPIIQGVYNYTDYNNGLRWSYLRNTMNPHSIKLTNSGRSMVRASYPGMVQTISRPFTEWVASTTDYPDLSTDTSLPAKIVKAGGMWGPYSHSKNPRINTGYAQRDLSISIQSTTENPSTDTTTNQFASEMIVDGNDLFMRAGGADTNTVYLYDITDKTAPSLSHTFDESVTETGEWAYGHAIAISDNWIAISSPAHASGGLARQANTGRVYVYNRSDNSLAYTINPYTFGQAGGFDSSYFGVGLAITDDKLYVGAPFYGLYDTSYNTGTGVVQIFDLSDGSYESTILNPDDDPLGNYTTTNNRFGYCIRVQGSTLYIGMPGAGVYIGASAYHGIGVIYRYSLTGTKTDSLKREYAAGEDNEIGKYFKTSANWLACSVFKQDYGSGGIKDTGFVVLYDLNSSNTSVFPAKEFGNRHAFFPEGSSKGEDQALESKFGWYDIAGRGCIALTDDMLVVGAPDTFYDSSLTYNNGAGAVYIYKGSRLDELEEYLTYTGSGSDGYGSQLAMDGSTLVIGSIDIIKNSKRGIFEIINTSDFTSTFDEVSFTSSAVRRVPDTLNISDVLTYRNNVEVNSYQLFGPSDIVLDPSGRKPVILTNDLVSPISTYDHHTGDQTNSARYDTANYLFESAILQYVGRRQVWGK